MAGPVVVIVGAQWGDEAKGRVVDLLASRAGMVVRYQGGPNAGHTVINARGTFKLHLVPAGILTPQVTSVIGNGVVIDPRGLLGELEMLRGAGVATEGRLIVSDRAHVIMPYHRLLDTLDEEERGGARIGTTGRGIGPAYVDKVARRGIVMGDLLYNDLLVEKVRANVARVNRQLITLYGRSDTLDADALVEELRGAARHLAPYIADSRAAIQTAIAAGWPVILEGAQGALLDVDFGTYPYVTSSSPAAGGACIGSGIAPTQITRTVGVYKAYCTRVGGGPFPTEMAEEMGNRVRTLGNEFGTTTGRPRRCGWFDAVAARYSASLNGFSSMAVTHLDVYDTLDSVRICTAYRINGELVETMPSMPHLLDLAQPVYEEVPGWQASTVHARQYSDLPINAQCYLRRLEEVTGIPTSVITVGPERDEALVLQDLLAPA